jgi:hypothetical protein
MGGIIDILGSIIGGGAMLAVSVLEEGRGLFIVDIRGSRLRLLLLLLADRFIMLGDIIDIRGSIIGGIWPIIGGI